MTPPPYQKLFWGSYHKHTAHLSHAREHGAYLLLIGALWNNDGRLPADDGTLAGYAKLTLKEWGAIKAKLMPLFRVTRHGYLYLADRCADIADQGREGRPYSPLWQALRAAVLERDGYACTYCGDMDGPLEADHVVPVISGGQDAMANLVCACRACNRSKGAKPIYEWLGAQ